DIVLERQLQEDFEYPQKVNPDLSVSVTRLILKMTAKEPVARFQTWDEVLAEVVRLERQMRQQAATVTQPTAVTGTAALAERAPAADSKKDDALAGDDLRCRYCGQPIQPKALYCGLCGKSVTVPAQESVEDRKQSTIRLKPMQANPPMKGKSAATHLKSIRSNPPANGKPAAPLVPAPRPRSASGHWYSSWGGNVRVVISLCLLAFLGYYAYQKVKYDHDVIIAIKAAIIRAVQPVLEKSRLYVAQGLKGGVQLSHGLIWERFMTKPEPPVDLPKAAPKEMSAPDKTPAPTESSESKPVTESKVAQESDSSPAPAAATVPEAAETAVAVMPEASVQSETPPPPAAPEPSKPKPEPEPAAAP
ncbi:MAG: hypothetical protein Q8O57_12655, partial [Kiritimatiellota bacterium]|nr:hypothetical protein [Kiritimatiellota bacterium]